MKKELKSKFSFSLDERILEIMDEYLEKEEINNRSIYLEKLIREDMEKRGKNVDREF